MSEIADLEPLTGLKRLQYLSLLDNPVTRKQWYRSWIIWKIPSIRVLDFKRERKEAVQLFVTANGEHTSLAKSISETISKTFEPGEGLVAGSNLPKSNLPTLGISAEEQAKIREAIRNAKTLEEVTRLEKLLQSGHIPGSGRQLGDNLQHGEEEMDD
ncbi:13525_t:CDS:2 [Acaulospora colombiana]|uniref:13525_t:CDS:1 n=1 Tax=Acaulospora colombiana TaxID=27376 RepID=A0ACA9K7E5_9GLOM|nr:13525_t:CDS:2 [Acaulospora colombiana]